MNKLTRNEFSMALEKGLGRAFFHVSEFGDEGVRDLLERAVTQCLSIDLVCEGTRAEWLFSMLVKTGDLVYFENLILEALPTRTTQADRRLCLDLLVHFARRGSIPSRSAIYSFFDDLRTIDDWWVGVEQIVDLDGIEGLVYVAEGIGKRHRVDGSDLSINLQPLSQIVEELGSREARRALKNRAELSDDLKFYLRKEAEREQADLKPRGPEIARRQVEWPLEMLLRALEQDTPASNREDSEFDKLLDHYRSKCSDEEIESLIGRIPPENRPLQLNRLFRLLRWRVRRYVEKNGVESQLGDKLLSLCENDDLDLCRSASLALSDATSPLVRETAFRLLSSSDLRRAVLGLWLLGRNSAPADASVILEFLYRISEGTNRDLIHTAVLAILSICESAPALDLKPYLLWVFEHSPCSECRLSAVTDLLRRNELPVTLQEECKYDGNYDIRKRIQVNDWYRETVESGQVFRQIKPLLKVSIFTRLQYEFAASAVNSKFSW